MRVVFQTEKEYMYLLENIMLEFTPEDNAGEYNGKMYVDIWWNR